MINQQLLHPDSIIVVGASNNVHKPGGALLRNLLNGKYAGMLYAVNPKETEVQGVHAYPSVQEVPTADLAVLAIPAAACPDAVDVLAGERCQSLYYPLSRLWRRDARGRSARRNVSSTRSTSMRQPS